MVQLASVVRSEFHVRVTHPSALALLALSILIALFSTLRPTVVDGNDLSLGWNAASQALNDGSVLACLVGPLLVLLGSTETFDQGMGDVRHMCGTQWTVTALSQLVVGIIGCLLAGLATAVFGVLGGVSDWLFRETTGAPSLITNPGWGTVASAGRTLAVACAATVVCWLVCLVFRSGIRALVTVVLLLTSWIALLSAVNERDVRPLLMAHPLAGPWRLLDPISAPSARVDGPMPLFLASLCGWSFLLLAAAVVRSRPARASH